MAPATQLSPQMRARYGLDRRLWPARLAAVALVVAYVAIMALVAVRMADGAADARILVWQQPAPDRVDVTFEVTKSAGMPLTCALRAQDADRVDIGYALAELDAEPRYQQLTYPLRVLAPAAVVEILGCGESADTLRVPPPSFPPGIVPPEQPWSPG